MISKYVAIMIIIVVLCWMVIGSFINKKNMSKVEFDFTVGAGILASTLIAIANFVFQ